MMRSIKFFIFLFVISSIAVTNTTTAQQTEAYSEYIFAFDDKLLKSLLSKNKVALADTLKPILPSPRGRTLATQTITRLKRKVIDRIAKGKQKHLSLINAKVLTLREGTQIQNTQTMDYAVNSGLVKYMNPNIKLKAFALPDDTDFSKLWGMNSSSDLDINAPEAWEIRKDTGDAAVGVLDTGVDPNTEDLQGNIWENSAEIPGNKIDDDKNGYVDDVYGCDFIAYDPTKDAYCGEKPFHEHEHGTHVAGTIGARGGNGIGVSGVAWKTKIVSLAFLGKDGSGNLDDMIEAMTYAVQLKKTYEQSKGKKGANIKVINASLGHNGGFLQSEFDGIAALGKADILLVAAAGNGGWDGLGDDNDKNPTYPAGYELDNIISVAALAKNGGLTNFSNYGANSVHIAAPGEAIYSTVFNNQYKAMSGTSMAAPHVAGAAALIRGHKPAMPAWIVKQVMIASVKNGSSQKSVGSLDSKVSSAGLLDIKEALVLSETNLDKPRITKQPRDQEGYVKGKTSVSVNVLGEEPLRYSWEKDGTNVGNKASLSFGALTKNDAGFYTCTVSNKHGSVTTNAIEIKVNDFRLGDLNSDGAINIGDMVIMMTSLGKKGKNLPADLNKDEVVDLKDLQLLLTALNS